MNPAKLYGGALSAAANTILYTVPVGKQAIVKQITIGGVTSAGFTVTLIIGGVTLVNTYAVPANGIVVLDLSQVLNAGDTIVGWAVAGGGGFVNVAVSGVVFP